jgi:hypothetical protein
VTIAQQIATPNPASRARRPAAPLQPVAAPRRLLALVRIAGLLALTALGTALFAGVVAISIMMVASSLGG